MSLTKNLKNAGLMSSSLAPYPSNVPEAFASRKKQWFGDETSAFVESMFDYASDVYEAKVQSINPDDWFQFETCTIRLMDIVSQTPTARGLEDYKLVYFKDQTIKYIGLGAKIILNEGNFEQVYLVVNPSASSVNGANCIVRRCNATWSFLDFYGNIQHEPFAWQTNQELASSFSYTDYQTLLSGYNHSTMQRNAQTRELHNNTRIMLADQAFSVRGLVNFLQEFSGDKESVRIQYFDLAAAEPTENDNIELSVAGYDAFSWKIDLGAPEKILVGQSAGIAVRSVRNGLLTESTQQHPVGYLWESADTEIATVDNSGVITGVSAGDAVITCRLEQNEKIFERVEVSVEAASSLKAVRFLTPLPESIVQYEKLHIEAATFDASGKKGSEQVTIEAFGANPKSFSATAGIDGSGSLDITCFSPSDAPLTVRASAEGYESATAQIRLEGY